MYHSLIPTARSEFDFTEVSMTKLSVKKPYTVLVGVVLVIVLGIVSFLGLNTDLLPTMDLPYVVVYTVYPGASPEKVEQSVTKPVESAVSTTSGLENITSISQENVSMIILEFSQSTNMDSAMLELSTNLDTVSGSFDDMVQSPVMMKLNPNMLPVELVSVDADGMDIKRLTEYVNTTLAPAVERIDGVASADVTGDVQDRVDIFLNQEKIDQINDTILYHVNKELYNTKKDLDSAQKKLDDAEAELKKQESDAIDKLARGSAELDAGLIKASALDSQLTALKARQALLSGAKEAVSGLAQLEGISTVIDGLISANVGFDENSTLNDVLASIDQISAMPDIPERVKNLLSTAEDAVKQIIDSGTATGDTTLGRLKTTINAQLEAARAALKEMGVDDSIISGGVIALESDLASVEREIAQTEFLSKQAEQAVTQLKETYAQLEKAKIQATEGLAVGTVQITNGKAQLESGIEQFNSARDTALKQANIDSLVTQSMLSNILTAQNFSMPAGYLNDGNAKYTVKVGDTFKDLDELKNLMLVDMGIDGMEPIYLKDVADIEINDNSDESYVRVNGNPAVVLSISKQSTASTSRVSDAVNAKFDEIMAENPSVHVTALMDQGVYIHMIISSVLKNLAYGGILAIIVLLVFLKDIKPTAIIACSIPISLLFAVTLMYFSNVTLNVMSLSGLALGVGMLVDNSIVVIENTYRLRNLGYSKVQAAVSGAKQVAGAIIASTLTTVCVFLPIVFTDGISRQLFTDMGLTIAYSLLASLIVALTVVPAMSSTMLTNTKENRDGFFAKLVNGYTKLLDFVLNHKWTVICLSLGLLIFSGYEATKMPMSFIPEMDSTQMTMTYTLDTEEYTEEELLTDSEKIAEIAAAVPGVETVGVMEGSSGISSMMSSSGNNSLSTTFYLVLSEDKELTNKEIADEIRRQTGDYNDNLSIETSTMDMSSMTGSGVSIKIKGDDLDELQQIATDMGAYLADVDGVASVDDGSENSDREIRIDVDKTKAMKYQLTVAQVYQKVSAALTDSTTATSMTIDGTDMKAIIHASRTYDRDSIENLKVATDTDKNGKETDVLLKDIASTYMATSPTAINRENSSRYKTVTLTLADGANATLTARQVQAKLQSFDMPKGYTYEMSGENETVKSAMTDLVKMIALACVFIYLIMVAQFQSLKSPFIVIFTIPLAFTGGLLALLVTGTELSVIAMIGFLVLSGVVVNNGIVFVDYINQLRLEGVEKRRAILQTGRDRIKPVLMTAMTTILANSIMAIGVDMGADMTKGMAIVTVGGLSYATLLTLFLIPTLYDIFNRKEMKKIEVEDE